METIKILNWYCGIVFEWRSFSVLRHLAESGAHVVFAVANTDAVRELIAVWEGEQNDGFFPLNCEVCFGFGKSVFFF